MEKLSFNYYYIGKMDGVSNPNLREKRILRLSTYIALTFSGTFRKKQKARPAGSPAFPRFRTI
ncbi:hypothetical protein LMZ02_15845 [Paenibacillus macerans]|uniref:hypothetical protein n=1 Tax=Paenibacillus macerans TaxID=44252 RepID=UPI001D131EE3|nr:hypothetical protein [Paenibacillus macerans]UMV45019.1 hypothetical protein LMZ02_15845 [Paenibacillus macerans]